MADDITTTSDLSSVMKTYYDRLMLERLTPQLRFHQFGDKKNLSKAEGKSISWTRFSKFEEGSTLTEGTKPSSITMSATSVSATLTQKGYLVQTTDLLEMTAICDVVKTAVELMTDQAALTVDGYIEERMQPYRSTGSVIGFRAAHPAFDCFRNHAGTWGLQIGGSANTITHSALRKQKLAVSSIRKMVTRLRSWNAPTFPDGYYVGIIRPEVADGLMADKEWQTWNQYLGNKEAGYKGEIGKAAGVRFVDTTHIDTIAKKSAAGSSLGIHYVTYIVGPHAYGVTDFDGGVHVYTVPSTRGDKADPLQQFSYIGWKVTLASKVLNDSCGLIALTSEN